MLHFRKRAETVQPRISISVCVMSAAFLVLTHVTWNLDARSAEPASGSASRTESARTILSGPKAGSTIHQFFVREVTGPHRNRSVCYVCRYGSRPVVMVVMQETDPEIATLLKAVDAIVDENRVSGLRSFGVFVTDESDRAVPTLQTMAFDERIQMPLTAATTAIAGPSCHNLHEDAATTVILYRDQLAVRNFAFEKDSINDESE